MNKYAVELGFWTSLIAAACFIIFTFCFAGIILTQETVFWTDTDTYLQAIRGNNPAFKYISQTSMLVFSIAYVILLHAIDAMVYTGKKLFSRVAISFGIMFALLIGINYFLQLTYVRFNVDAGSIEGLGNWIMFNPNSVSLSMAILGWTFMFALSSLFVAPVFQGKGRHRTIRILFQLNGIFCLLGGLGYVIQNVPLINLGINLGMGSVVTILTIVLTLHFRQERKYL
jgi:hypothetical protein